MENTDKKQALAEFMKYTLLNVLGMAGLSCYILADTFFISKGIEANGLAALNLALPVYSIVNGSGLMLGMGGATKYSVFKGQKSLKDADRVFTVTVWMAAALSAVFLFLGIAASGRLTVLLGADAEVFGMANTYLKVILLFSPAFIMNNIFVCFVRNDKSPRLAMAAMLLGSFSNIIFDYIFIFHLRLGILGAVLATGWSPLIGMAVLLLHKIRKKNQFHFIKGKPRAALVAPVISLGFPSFITEVSSGIVIFVFNMLILELEGNIGIAAYGVIANLSLVVVSIHTGIAQGMQPLASRAYGAGDLGHMKQLLRYGIIMALAVSAAVYILMYAFAGQLAGIFNSEGNARLQEIAVGGIRLYFTAVPFIGFNIVISSFFTSAGRAVSAHLISVSRGFLILIPMAFLLAHMAGLTGVWLALPVTEGIVCAAVLLKS